MQLYPVLLLAVAAVVAPASAVSRPPLTTTIKHDHPLIYYHGRWDSSPGTWWAGSGFKVNVKNLKALSLNLGEHTTAPSASIGVSVGGSEFFTVNVSAGANPLPLNAPPALVAAKKPSSTLVRINVEGWQNNRINLESITLNSDASLLPYEPSKLAFQFIGDSLSAGQFLPQGVDQAWPFLVGEKFKAEHRINAQPGAALTDILSYGNVHGVSYQFFKTEDTGFYYTTDHNFTTNWNFARENPHSTHIIIHIGANDASQGVSNDQFVQVYSDFLGKIRALNPKAPIFVFTPWGWPNSDGTISYYYDGQYQKIVDDRKALGDKNIFLVDTTGWVAWADVFPDNVHPNVAGHQKIANEFIAWLAKWGLSPQ
ncbi:SGNH hydrolase [Agrocybe pediades]|nr:SGNH hydrolase [Agrocybe pediades]